jgi:hypothetical protein
MRKDDTYDYTGLERTESTVSLCTVQPCILISSLGLKPEFLSLEGHFFYGALPTSPASALGNDLNLGCPEGLDKQMNMA